MQYQSVTDRWTSLLTAIAIPALAFCYTTALLKQEQQRVAVGSGNAHVYSPGVAAARHARVGIM